jgi:N-acyl-phosphatidylethanolamine-hydrolysing phospholipase D
MWLGHATGLLQAGGSNLLFDPVFSERASPISLIGPKRHNPPPVTVKDLPYMEAVFISHNQHNQLDKTSVLTVRQQPGGSPRLFGRWAWQHGLKTWA